MRLILVRHGQTPSNVRGLLDTAVPGPGLTDLGHEQARAVVEALAQQPVDSITVSDLTRTHLTAAPLAQARGLEPVERGGVREIQAGEVEMKADEASVDLYLGTGFAWARGDLDRRMPGGEDGHEFYERYDGVIREVEGSGAQCAVVVSHGAAMRVWVAGRAANVDPDWAFEHRVSNTGVFVLDGSMDEGWVCTDWEDQVLDVPQTRPGPTGEPLSDDGPAGDPLGSPSVR